MPFLPESAPTNGRKRAHGCARQRTEAPSSPQQDVVGWMVHPRNPPAPPPSTKWDWAIHDAEGLTSKKYALYLLLRRITRKEIMGITRETIRENSGNPELLEELYHSNKKIFSAIIYDLYSQDQSLIIRCWYARLFYKAMDKPKNNASKYIFTAFLIIFAWIPARLSLGSPLLIEDTGFYLIPATCSFALSLYFLFKPVKVKHLIFSLLMHGAIYIYFILLPNRADSRSLTNAFYFMFILLWFFVLLAQSRFKIKELALSAFLEITGEVIVWATLFILGGIVIVILSLSLFDTIGINAHDFYMNNIVTLGLTASPFISLLVIENIKKIKLSRVIANIFLPVILVSILAFGVVSLFTEKKPYEDRDVFILYNIMMVIVICVLAFKSINKGTSENNRFLKIPLIAICAYILPVVTIAIDIITISAVIYRLNKYGITPNKITLLGTNIIMLGHLIYMTCLQVKQRITENVNYLPIYALWALCVIVIFPFIFNFR
jgi:hypothetical protein